MIYRYVACCFAMHGVSALLSALFLDYYQREETVLKKKGRPDVILSGRRKAWATWCKRVSWDYTTNSAVYASAVFCFYLSVVLENYGSLESRWVTTSFATKHGISLHVASSIYETICYALSGKEFVFYLHHVVTMGCCASMLLTGRGSFWCCVLGLVEGSNVPLCFLTVMTSIPSLKGSILFVINGGLLWIAYVVLRIPIPVAMYYLAVDLRSHSKAAGGPAWVFSNEETNTAWIWFLFTSGTFLWVLSMYWFKKITDGILKALGWSSTKKPKTKEN